MKKQKVRKMVMKEIRNLKQQPLKSNQLSCGEMICGSVKVDDSSINNNNASMQQYISMINDEMKKSIEANKIKC